MSVVARGQPCMLVGDFNVEPTEIPCLAKGISAGLWVDLDVAWAMAGETQPAASCKRTWDSTGGASEGFYDGWFVFLLLQRFLLVVLNLIGGLHLIWLLGRILIVVDGPVMLTSLFSVLLFGLLPGCLLWTRVRAMARSDASLLDKSLRLDDVSEAWMVWSGAAEAAFADAYCFAGVPVPERNLVLGRGCVQFRVVRLGGLEVRKARD